MIISPVDGSYFVSADTSEPAFDRAVQATRLSESLAAACAELTHASRRLREENRILRAESATLLALKIEVGKFVQQCKSSGATPERMLVELKSIVLHRTAGIRDPDMRELIAAGVVGWSIEAYYGSA